MTTSSLSYRYFQSSTPLRTGHRYLQVVFDLQSADAHDAAVDLFQRIMQITDEEKIQRELF